jgi:chloramphenicol 3-O-phosphotransferase
MIVHQASAVVIDGRALLIEGPPGSGKSSLALALIDRGRSCWAMTGSCSAPLTDACAPPPTPIPPG